MVLKKTLTLLILSLMLCFYGRAQEKPAWSELNERRIEQEKRGMVILGSWAAGNMIWAGAAAGNAVGIEKGFHQMNLYWNSVNFLIAGLGYWSATKETSQLSVWESVEAQHNIEKILLVNAALDVGYMAGGLYWLERGKNLDREQWEGFGRSLVLQGAFLMSFDLLMYHFQRQNGKSLPKFFENVDFNGNGLGLQIKF